MVLHCFFFPSSSFVTFPRKEVYWFPSIVAKSCKVVFPWDLMVLDIKWLFFIIIVIGIVKMLSYCFPLIWTYECCECQLQKQEIGIWKIPINKNKHTLCQKSYFCPKNLIWTKARKSSNLKYCAKIQIYSKLYPICIRIFRP